MGGWTCDCWSADGAGFDLSGSSPPQLGISPGKWPGPCGPFVVFGCFCFFFFALLIGPLRD